MNDQQIRKIVREEIQRANNSSRFRVQSIPEHTHNGIDSPKIAESNLIRTPILLGSIEFSSDTTYSLKYNAEYTPSMVTMYSNVIGPSGERFVCIGSAYLTPSFYFQPSTSSSVEIGNIQYPFEGYPAQSSVYFGTDSGGSRRTVVSQFAIISVEYPLGTVLFQMKVKGFSKTDITIENTVFTTGWSANSAVIIQ